MTVLFRADLDNVLLLGRDGMLGTALCRLLDGDRIQYHAPRMDEIDFTKPATIEAIDARYGWVINAAAHTDVDRCESEEPLARQINALGPALLARRCQQTRAKLVHFSTDYVFSGDATTPYVSNAPTAPRSAYGRTKAEGESLVAASGCDYLIVRTSWLYAPWGDNFVRTMFRLACERDVLKVVDDQRGNPTSSEQLADATIRLMSRGASGVYHVTDRGNCTWFEFAREIVRQSKLTCQVHPCTTAEFPRPAPRPRYSVLDLSRTESVLGPLREWRRNLSSVLDRVSLAAV